MSKTKNENLALYRKYRPQTFNEVLGQDQVVKVLESSIKGDKVSHAYLFIGSRGTGKTSVARIFAKEIGVSQNDIYEIDAASNRKIDDIKELRDGVNVLPFDSKYKIYIIDEVHMLSHDAWGALLKTLEEPPRHVIFILATTELHKVPDTIVSRCQVFTFRKASDIVSKNMILDIVQKEGYEMEVGAAELLAILGDGSYRDAIGYLQKVLNFTKGKKIKLEEVEKIVGAPSTVLVNDFISAIASDCLEKGIEAVRKASIENLDMKLYLKRIIQKMRMAIILRYAPKLEKQMQNDLRESDLDFLKNILQGDSVKNRVFNSETLSILLEAYENIDRSFVSELPLEMALVKILKSEKNPKTSKA
ncbi:MAG TPA: DNA polymerase III subunit gamma/tau [Candidatus Paceibacterota bacterium]|nr:DNA polymerase III subunit gamma/tau [Candidatus Paceibacterota bacterium]HPT18103.1 DNA polymerase III subunit gamma/tau [Candidatus Paceibacterota bacterium]